MHRAVLLHVAIGGWLVAASERALLLVGPPPVRSNLPPLYIVGGVGIRQGSETEGLVSSCMSAASVLIVAGGAATYQGGSLPSIRKLVPMSTMRPSGLSFSELQNILHSG